VNRIFVDTSALFALVVSSDANHERAKRAFRALTRRQAALVSSSYVLLETYALLHRRVGLAAVAALRDALSPLLDVVWIDAQLHDAGIDLLLERRSKKLSLVDAVSFLVARTRDVDAVFAYDRDFEREGLSLVG
jgi:predicted nucleic acid-binding protein